MKNPRTHIEKEKALYTDYEIELKVSLILVLFWLLINTRSQFVVNSLFLWGMTLSVYKLKTSSSLNTQEVQDRLNVRAVERDEMKSPNHNSHNIFREFSFQCYILAA